MVDSKKRGLKMLKSKKSELANAHNEVKRFFDEFGVTTWMLQGPIAEGRNKE